MSGPSQIYDVDLKLLRCFCAIVEEGSFTAAQATLNLSQSVLSEHLKSLEIRLGTRLCQRGQWLRRRFDDVFQKMDGLAQPEPARMPLVVKENESACPGDEGVGGRLRIAAGARR